MKFTTDDLRSVRLLAGLPEPHLEWLAANGERVDLARGDHMFELGQPSEYMFVVVSGTIEGFEEVGGELLLVATTRAGEVTGMLPYSRMTHYPRFTAAVEASRVLRVDQCDFAEMLAVSHELGQRLVAEMADRVRGDVRLEQQHEKMAALGRLSAGLAHELNNPAAAISRAATILEGQLPGLSDLVSRLIRHHVDDSHLAALRTLRLAAGDRTLADVSALVRSQREDALGTWLEDRNVPKPWDKAGTFVDAGLVVDDLEDFGTSVPPELQADALTWVACDLAVKRLVSEVTSSAGRITELVGSVKTYSHMDRSPEHKPTNVLDGIDNTLTLLGYQLNKKNIRLHRDYQDGLPTIPANQGELNQVWTNLLDNAIAAVEPGGAVRVAVSRDEDHLTVDIVDDGHGIPDDVQSRMFEPFFTTKGVGEGTGLGLDIALRIVRTHRGQITVESKPGRTVVQVRLPIAPPSG